MTGCTFSDVAVIGAGPTGLVAALTLAKIGAEVVILAPDQDAASGGDTRSTALLPSSIDFLRNLGVWSACAEQSAPLRGVRIIDACGGVLRAPDGLFLVGEVGLPDFGANIANAVLMAALQQAVCHDWRIRRAAHAAVTAITPVDRRVRLALADGSIWAATLVVGADGR